MFTAARYQLAGVLVRRDARESRVHATHASMVVMSWFVVRHYANRPMTAAPGRDLVETLTWLAAVMLVFSAFDALNSFVYDEWTGPNLDLLRMTGLSGLDILIAKLIPDGLTAGVILLLQVPAVCLAVTLGGVTYTQLAASAVELMAIFVVAVGCTIVWVGPATTGNMKRVSSRTMAIITMVLYLVCCTCADQLVDIFGLANGGTVAGQLSHRTFLNPLSQLKRIGSSGFVGPIVGWTLPVHAVAVGVMFVTATRWLQQEWTVGQSELDLAAPEPSPAEHDARRCGGRCIRRRGVPTGPSSGRNTTSPSARR